MPVILVTWKVDLERFAIPGQLGQNSSQGPISTEKSWEWWHMPVSIVMVGSTKQEVQGPGQHGQRVRPYLQNTQSKKE
jgi:hypothetical protein